MITDNLKKLFNINEFRPGQKEVIDCVLAGRDAVALMPTGGGKSLCFQLPAVVKPNLTIVISPLIALMKDQVDSLTIRGISAAYINSSQSKEETDSVLARAAVGALKILYIAPERLRSCSFINMFAAMKVDFIAVDEAHCVSSWGHDFRPDYMLIRDFIAEFKDRPAVAAFTATATPEVRDDIVQHLNLHDPGVFVRGFDRPNLKFIVQNNLANTKRGENALEIIRRMGGSGIVYALTRKETEALADFFNARGIKSIAYHAGMKGEDRTRVQEEFMENKYKVIVATIAFGMGVNKADIRFVIHVGMPGSLENYYQEAGRAGRDGEPAECVLLASRQDFGLHNFFIGKSRDEMVRQGKGAEEISRITGIKYRKLEKMQAYVDARSCRRKIILQYFADADIQKYNGQCGGCDVCLKIDQPRERFDIAELKRAARRARSRHSAFDRFENEDAYIDEMLRRSEPDEWDDFDEDEADEGPDLEQFYRRRGVAGRKDYSHNELGLPDTVIASVDLYRAGHKAKEIAKLRGFGVGTIFGHLIRWYEAGGDLKVADFVTPEQEQMILAAAVGASETGYLSSIKVKLPPEISYEQIRLTLAKVQRVKL